MDATGVASAIGGMGNLFGNILGVMAQENTNLWNASNVRYSYDQQKEMIAQQNVYNSPLQQMARYKEAGLNPNLIYGNITPGQQSEIAKYEPPVIQTPKYENVGASIAQAVNNFMDNELKKADLDIRHQQFENLKEEQFRIRAQRHAQDIDNMWNSVLKGFDPGLVSQAGDKEGIMRSQGYLKYAAELKSVQTMADLREAQKAYIGVQKEVQSLNKAQKEYYNENILPLMKEIMEKRRDGLDTSNELLKLQKNFFIGDKVVGYAGQIGSLIAKFLNPAGFLIPQGSPTMGPYSGWPSNPSW